MSPKPQEFTATITNKEQLSSKTVCFDISLIAPKSIHFTPGQFVNIDVGHGTMRPYSITSAPSRTRGIELLVDTAPGGPGSHFFQKATVGDTLTFVGPMGRFTLVRDTGIMIFLAAGTGVAPFKSMIEYFLEGQQRDQDVRLRDIYLYMSFRYEENIFWQEYFEALERQYSNFHFMLTLSRPGKAWEGCKGYVQSCIDKQLLKGKENEFYVCGGTQMVEGVVSFLRENNVPEEKIHFEPF